MSSVNTSNITRIATDYEDYCALIVSAIILHKSMIALFARYRCARIVPPPHPSPADLGELFVDPM